jgi:hypothetical protein
MLAITREQYSDTLPKVSLGEVKLPLFKDFGNPKSST